MQKTTLLIFGKIAFGIVLLVLWEVIIPNFPRSKILLGTPSSVISYAFQNSDRLFWDLAYTALEALTGLAIAVTSTLISLILVFQRSSTKRTLRKIIISFQVIPIIVFIPFIASVIGIGFLAKSMLAAIVATLPMIAVCLDGYDQLPRYIFDMIGIYNIPRHQAIIKLFLPMLLPDIFAGAKLGATMSVLGAVIAEFSGAQYGLGKNIFSASNYIEPELMLCSIILCILISLVFYWVIDIVGNESMPWLKDDKNSV